MADSDQQEIGMDKLDKLVDRSGADPLTVSHYARLIREKYDTNHDGDLSQDEIDVIIADYRVDARRNNLKPELLEALQHYDNDGNNDLDSKEISALQEDLFQLRLIAYTAAVTRAVRYLAFTSDLGEAARPVVSLRWVRASYGVSWGYCIVDVVSEGRTAMKQQVPNADIAKLVAERAVFQSLASMALPAFTIHTTVKLAKPLFARISRPGSRVTTFGPSLAGLCVVPFLPLMFDHPVETAVRKAFHYIGVSINPP